MKDIKKIIIIVLAVLTIGGIVGTFSFKNMYDDLKTRIETVDATPEAVKLKSDLDHLQSQFSQISVELDIVRSQRDEAEQATANAVEKSDEVAKILNDGLKSGATYTTSSDRLRAYLMAIQAAVRVLK